MSELLSLRALAGSRAIDYKEHIVNALSHTINTFCTYKILDYAAHRGRLISAISNSISDRAPVNRAVLDILRATTELELLELKCNLHPLDGIANHTRQTLKTIDEEQGIKSELTGTDCCVANFIYQLSKLKYVIVP